MSSPQEVLSHPRPVWRDYLELCKPKVVALMLLTSVIGMLLATPTMVSLDILFWGNLGIALCAGSAAAINHIVDRQIDQKMKRTHNRPLAKGRVELVNALVFAFAIGTVGMLVLLLFVNALTAWLTLASLVGYALIYTLFLKRATPQNIVIGGAAGSFPPMIGWVAVTGSISLESVVLFLIIFMWTPPHFWALALYRCRDYERVGVPMLPVVKGPDATRSQILIYSFILFAVSLTPAFISLGGLIYLTFSVMAGIVFLYLALQVYRVRVGNIADAIAKKLFLYSIFYLFFLFSVLLIEHVVPGAFYSTGFQVGI